MDAQFHERPFVHQQRQPLAGGQLVLLVLARDPLLAPTQTGLRAAFVQILDERPQGRSGHQLARGCTLGHGRDRRSSSGSSTRIAVSAMSARSSASPGASNAVISRPTSSDSSATASMRS